LSPSLAASGIEGGPLLLEDDVTEDEQVYAHPEESLTASVGQGT
jgi:hypothetical protein